MAIFSFRPSPPGSARSRAGAIAADWAETRPSTFDDELLVDAAFGHGAFATDLPAPTGFAPPSAAVQATAPMTLGIPVPPVASPQAVTQAPQRPDPGFAKNLTARAQSDDLLGAGWYLSSWDLMQGCDVIEGTPIDLLPPEWQRKRPRL